MQFKSLFLGAVAASGALAADRLCGFKEPSAEDIAIAQAFAAEEAAANETMSLKVMATTNVNVYFHVIATSQSASGGYIPAATLAKQIDTMNSRFAPYGFAFTQAGADWTVNSGWARDGSELAMKKQLRKGTYKDLNMYLLADMDYLGYAYLPKGVSSGSSDFYYDGVSILGSTVPGGSYAGYNLGLTAVHETGHWLGLYHTFEGGCSGQGDYVADTPAEASAASGCPIGRDTCPGGGVDPIHNYMDYSQDSCYEEFTPGQVTRMNSYWTTYRAK
ncbi:metalloprotease [Apiospora kogelbergensis]|uniref:metalloprotease n=1 Tax=Apiospora kogelbergensis TaxID=1337665 RepID=UPI0031309CDD